MVRSTEEAVIRALRRLRIPPDDLAEYFENLLHDEEELRRFLEKLESPKHSPRARSTPTRAVRGSGWRATLDQLRQTRDLAGASGADEITKALQERGIENVPQYRSKDGLPRWLERVAREVPAPILMQVLIRLTEEADSERLPWRVERTDEEEENRS